MNDFELRRRLQELDAERSPDSDLWPGISARLADAPRHVAVAGKRWQPAAMAASVLLAVAVAASWWPRPAGDSGEPAAVAGTSTVPTAAVPAPAPSALAVRAPVPPTAPRGDALLVQADALTLEYVAALEQIGGAGLPPGAPGSVAPALADLDRSATEIRAALHEAPRASFLLAQLRRTYAQRLRLTQEAMAS